jgi:hypothetical protein
MPKQEQLKSRVVMQIGKWMLLLESWLVQATGITIIITLEKEN